MVLFFSLGPSGVKIMTRNELFNLMQQQNLSDINKKLEFIEEYLTTYNDYSEECVKDIKHKFSYVKSEFKRRWSAAQKKEELFVKNNYDRLQGTFEIPKVVKRSGRPGGISNVP